VMPVWLMLNLRCMTHCKGFPLSARLCSKPMATRTHWRMQCRSLLHGLLLKAWLPQRRN
jgi:hypothetical protein